MYELPGSVEEEKATAAMRRSEFYVILILVVICFAIPLSLHLLCHLLFGWPLGWQG